MTEINLVRVYELEFTLAFKAYNQFGRKGIDKDEFGMYNNFCTINITGVSKLDRGNSDLEKYSRGRRGAPAKGVGRATGARVQIPLSPFSS